MKQALSLATFGVFSTFTSINGHSQTYDRNFMDLVYGSGAVTLDNFDILWRGGELVVAGVAAANVPIYYQSLTETTSGSGLYEPKLYSFDSYTIEPIDATLDAVFPEDVALSPADDTNNLFVSGSTSGGIGRVAYYQGQYSSWSFQQFLAPQEEYLDEANFFGYPLVFDKSTNYDTLYVGCSNCSSANAKRHGSIYTYKQGANKAWSQSQIIYFPGVYNLGWEDVVVKGDLLLADISRVPRDFLPAPTSYGISTVLLRKDPSGKFNPEQILSLKGNDINAFDVEDDTIVLGGETATYKTEAEAGAVYILAPATLPPPAPGKPRPVQWSVQQVLWASTPNGGDKFGHAVSLDGDRLSVVADATDVSNYIFQRSQNGKWSLQQTLTLQAPGGGKTALNQGTLVTLTDSSIDIFDEFQDDECLVVSLEDQFGDGWDIAKLVINRPDGSKDYLLNHCDTENPHQVRYCPRDPSDGGLYRFSIVDGQKATNNWEINWRVLNEKTGEWVVGDISTKLDFEWDSSKGYFVDRKVEKALPNATCVTCPGRPTEKPTPALRRLKGGDDSHGTHHPTHTPAPTIPTTDGINWRTLTLTSDAPSGPWFDGEYRGAYYYVSDAKSRRLITKGTLCETGVTTHDCWVDLPDGEYNIRVGGALARGPAAFTWKYCSAANSFDAQEQITVKIEDGSCTGYARHSHLAFCGLADPTTVVVLDFMVMGASVSNSLSVNDRAILSQAIAFALEGVSTEDVVISSAVPSGSGSYLVSAQVNFRHSTTGYDTLTAEGVHSLLNSVEAFMAAEGPRKIWSGLQAAEHSNIFHTSTSVQFISAQVIGSKDVITSVAVDEVVTYSDASTVSSHESKSQSSSSVFEPLSYAGYGVAGVIAALVVGLFAFGRKKEQVSLPVSQEESVDVSKRIQLKDLNLAAPSMSDLKQLVKDEDEVLKSMMLSRP